MSSGNLVSVIYAPETVYGVTDTPLSGVTAETARFTSESLSGTPTTTSSTEIRTDRMSGGLVATGLEVGGSLETELAAGQFWDDMFEGAMMEAWTSPAVEATDVTLTPNPLDDQEAQMVITGSYATLTATAGDIVQIVAATGMPVTVQIIEIESDTEARVATKAGELAIVAQSLTLRLPQLLVIGKTQYSYTMAKAYTDVLHAPADTDVHSQTYNGTLVNGFSMSATYGEIVTNNFETVANGYLIEPTTSFEQQIVAAGGTVNPASTTGALNASIDFPLFTGENYEATDFCVESLSVTLTNNLDPSNCIGRAAPTAYTLGTANVAVTVSAYLSDSSYDAFMNKKQNLDPISITVTATNNDGGYAFRVQAAQLVFPDPSSEGQDTQTMIEAAGEGKVGANGESAIVIYKLLGEQGV